MVGQATGDQRGRLQSTAPYYHIPVVFALPRGRRRTAIEKLLLPFDRALWAASAAAFVVAAALLAVLMAPAPPPRRGRRRPTARAAAASSFDMFGVWMGGGVRLAPGDGGDVGSVNKPVAAPAVHGWLLLWLWVALLLRTLYLGYMFTFMQSNAPVQPPDTLAGLSAAGYRFMCDGDSAAYFGTFEVLGRK